MAWGIFSKLRKILRLDYFVHLIVSFLGDWTFWVKIYNALSLERHITACVPMNACKSTAVLCLWCRNWPRQLCISRVSMTWSNYVCSTSDFTLTLDSPGRPFAQIIRHCASTQLYKVWPILSTLAITPKLGKTIINICVAGNHLCQSRVGYLAIKHKCSLLSVFNRGLKLAAHVPCWFSSHVLRRGLGVHSLND